MSTPRFITLAVRVRYLEGDLDKCTWPCPNCPTTTKLFADEVQSNLEGMAGSIGVKVTVLTETDPESGNTLVQSVAHEQEEDTCYLEDNFK